MLNKKKFGTMIFSETNTILMKKFVILLSEIFLFSCTSSNIHRQNVRSEVFATEANFNKMCTDKGIAEAFIWYADEEAVIRRGNDSLIKGKAGIKNYYKKDTYRNAVVSWKPDQITVSKLGDMAYSYGKYTWKVKDKEGIEKEYKGIYMTIWKKQKDGSWRYVWD
jgi:ketosteroid isomerase-like protein